MTDESEEAIICMALEERGILISAGGRPFRNPPLPRMAPAALWQLVEDIRDGPYSHYEYTLATPVFPTGH